MTQAAPRRRKTWIIAAPLALLVLLACAWTALWFYAARRAQTEIDAWILREAEVGRQWSCGERSLAGFPFRFELVCRAPTLSTKGGDPLRITAASAHAVAQIWNPNHIVAEFASPAKVEDLSRGVTYAATWSLLQMSDVGDSTGKPQRLSVVADQVRLEVAAPGGVSIQAYVAQHAELHMRRTPGGSGGRDGMDFALSLIGGESAALAATGTSGPVDMTLQGHVSAADDMRAMSVPDRLRAWTQAGGVFRLDTLQITTPKSALELSGTVSIDSEGRLNGPVKVGFSGVDDSLKALARAGLVPAEVAPIVGALMLTGKPGDVAGRKGSTFSLTLRQGALQLGRYPVGVIPPLF